MRLREFTGPVADSGRILLPLKNFKDQADQRRDSSEIDFDALKKIIPDLDSYGISDIERFEKFVQTADPENKIVKQVDVTTGKIYLDTEVPADNPNQPNSQVRMPTNVDKMASSALPANLKP